MALRINRDTVKYAWDSCLDIAVFAGMGYFAGRAVNVFTKWSAATSLTTAFFKKPTQMDVTGTAICCGLFAAIDRIAHVIFMAYVDPETVNKPVYSALRMGASAFAAVTVFNALASHLKQTSLEMKPMAAVIVTAIVIYGQILTHLAVMNARYQHEGREYEIRIWDHY